MFYLIQTSYEASASAALVKHPDDRERVFRELVQKAGGKLHAFYFALGDDDVVAIFEAPDNTTALAFGMAVTSGGFLRRYRTTALMTSQEAVAAMKRAGTFGQYKTPMAA